MASSAASRPFPALPSTAEHRHRMYVWAAALVAVVSLTAIAIYGYPYYRLDLAARARSPYHAALRPSGYIGLRLGMLGAVMFCVLFLYALRKRWTWLGKLGKTKHWLNFHVVIGFSAPVLITFHSSFKFGGLAGVAYWIMIAVALSGIVGRYLYALIPRNVAAAELSIQELEMLRAELAAELQSQRLFSWDDLMPLFRLPSREEAAGMPLLRALAAIVSLDIARPLRVARLRWRALTWGERAWTLAGLLKSSHPELEEIVMCARRQSSLSARLLFLERTQSIFHLWHVVHKPFSYSFAVLVLVHIGVAILLGYF
jgi:hypothetical protein